MAKPFDATLKDLLDRYAADWVGWLGPAVGLPPDLAADPLDPDLSTAGVQADKVFRLRRPAAGLLHVEPQASWDGDLPDRLLVYNVLLHRRHGGPVHSLALLLRREANAAALTGELERADAAGRVYLRFRYAVVRLWDQPVGPLLAGPLGTLPLAPLTDEAAGDVPAVLAAIGDRLRALPGPPEVADHLWTSTYFLLGLRFEGGSIDTWFREARGMEESTTYQLVLRKGAARAQQDDVLALLEKRFGPVPEEVARRVRAVTDEGRLRAALLRVPDLGALAEFEV